MAAGPHGRRLLPLPPATKGPGDRLPGLDRVLCNTSCSAVHPTPQVHPHFMAYLRSIANASRNFEGEAFAQYILRGIWQGFRIGFDRRQQLVPARRNSPSAWEHPEVVEQYNIREITAGRMIGSFLPDAIPRLHTRCDP